MKEFWFAATDGKYYNNTDVVKTAWMLSETELKTEKDVISYAETLPGLIPTPVNPSVEMFLLANMPTQAIRGYYKEHQTEGVNLVESRDIVNEMKKQLAS